MSSLIERKVCTWHSSSRRHDWNKDEKKTVFWSNYHPAVTFLCSYFPEASDRAPRTITQGYFSEASDNSQIGRSHHYISDGPSVLTNTTFSHSIMQGRNECHWPDIIIASFADIGCFFDKVRTLSLMIYIIILIQTVIQGGVFSFPSGNILARDLSGSKLWQPGTFECCHLLGKTQSSSSSSSSSSSL